MSRDCVSLVRLTRFASHTSNGQKTEAELRLDKIEVGFSCYSSTVNAGVY